VDKENRIESLRRQRLLQGEKKIKKITRQAAAHLDENPGSHFKLKIDWFKKKGQDPQPTERPFPLSANEKPNDSQQQKVRKIRLGWRFFSGILVLLFSACLLVGWRSADFQVGPIEIKGTGRISPELVEESFNESQKPIFSVIPDEITQKIIHAFPEFKNIQVDTSFPNKISISLAERNPVLAWKINDILIWIDEEGIIIPARGQYNGLLTIESSSLPIFSHPKSSNDSDPEIEKYLEKHDYWKLPPYSMIWFEYHRYIERGLLNAIVQLNSQIPAERTFIYDPHRGLGWNDAHGWKIFVGLDLEKINEKMLAYEKIVNELTSQGIRPSLISVEYLHAPYYRLD
jgi:cell division protein FtsQ